MDTANIVELSQVQFRWKKSDSLTLDINELVIQKQKHLFIKGPSGCGKSTLLGLLTGINQPQKGQVKVMGTDLATLTSADRDRFRANHIGYIFQQFNLLPYLNVLENVMLPCHFSQLRREKVAGNLQEHAVELLRSLGLSFSLFNKPVIELSIGQQQRVAAARALIGYPELLIADEPTSSLDHDNRNRFIELLMEQAAIAQSTLIFVSHDTSLESMFNQSIDLQEINRVKKEYE